MTGGRGQDALCVLFGGGGGGGGRACGGGGGDDGLGSDGAQEADDFDAADFCKDVACERVGELPLEDPIDRTSGGRSTSARLEEGIETGQAPFSCCRGGGGGGGCCLGVVVGRWTLGGAGGGLEMEFGQERRSVVAVAGAGGDAGGGDDEDGKEEEGWDGWVFSYSWCHGLSVGGLYLCVCVCVDVCVQMYMSDERRLR